MITSADNPQIKQIGKLLSQAKERRTTGLFVAEGRKLFYETPVALRRGIYVAASYEQAWKEETATHGIHSYEVVEDRLFRKLCDTKTPQGILTVAEMPHYDRTMLLPKADNKEREETVETWLVLENIQDPGNIGTILRTAEAAGVRGIFLSRDSADPFQPKAIRSSMGSIYRMPFVIEEDLSAAIMALKEREVVCYATAPEAEDTLVTMPSTLRRAYLLGNEGNGLSARMQQLADRHIRIPMQGKVESLNVAIATAILLFDKA